MNVTRSSGDIRPTFPGRFDKFSQSASAPFFIYGTLLFPEVLRAIIGRVPQGQAVRAIGWRVVALRNRVYPGLISVPGEIACGRLLLGLSDDEWRLLDSFEDPKYELEQICLACGGTGLTYVWVDDAEACVNSWDAQNFAVTHLPAYVERCAARYSRRRASAQRPDICLDAGE